MKKEEITLLWRGNKIPCEDCKVVFKFVDEVPPTASGKYLYTISEVTE